MASQLTSELKNERDFLRHTGVRIHELEGNSPQSATLHSIFDQRSLMQKSCT